MAADNKQDKKPKDVFTYKADAELVLKAREKAVKQKPRKTLSSLIEEWIINYISK